MTRRGHSLHSIYSSRARLVIQAPQAWVAGLLVTVASSCGLRGAVPRGGSWRYGLSSSSPARIREGLRHGASPAAVSQSIRLAQQALP